MFEFSAKFFGDRKRAVDLVKEHPVILSLLLCLFLCSVSFMEQYYIDYKGIFTVFFALVVLSFCAVLYLRAQYGLKFVWAIVAFVLLAGLSFLMCWRISVSERKTASILIFCFIILITVSVFLIATKQMTVGKLVGIILIGAIFLRFGYISITSISARAHDVVNYAGTDNPYTQGHMGYILYMYNNGFALPQVIDANGNWFDQAYHPPLHHFIAAVWLKMLNAFGVTTERGLMSVQTLTLFYSAVSTIYAYKILKRFKIDDKIRVLLFLIIAFHPSFFYMAADVNNDMLSVALMFVALYHAIRWHESGKIKDIIFTALAVGFAMMAKLSAYLICVPIAVIFAVRFFGDIKAKNNIKPLIIQFVVFIAICAPLGLFSPIKNSIKYNISLTFVQRLPDDSWQYVGNYSIGQRLFDFKSLFTNIYDQWNGRNGGTYHDFNPLVCLIKTSVFEEYINNSGGFAKIDFWAHILYVSNIIIVLVSLVGAVYLIVSAIVNKKLDVPECAIGAGYIIMLMFYYIFCFEYPHHCTENMRYVTPLILYGTIFIGRAFDKCKTDHSERKSAMTACTTFKVILYVSAIAFALSSLGMVLKMIRA